MNGPVGVAVDYRNNLVYVCESGNSRVSIFSTDGEFIKSFGQKGDGPAQFNWPRGIALDKSGTLYICDFFNSRIQVFN